MKKNGFTLLELLAVIVILALIALIVTPIIINIINNYKKESAKLSATSYIKAVETYIAISETDKTGERFVKNNTYYVTKETEINHITYPKLNDIVKLNGSKPTGIDDYVILDKNYQGKEASLTIDGYHILIKDGKVINIEKGEDILAETLTFNKDKVSIGVGDTLRLEVTIEPFNVTNKTITWKSSDANIVTVDNKGYIKGVGSGKATITASTSNHLEAKAEVMVYKANYGTSISSSYDNIYLKDSEGTRVITKTANLDNYYSGNYKYTYSLFDEVSEQLTRLDVGPYSPSGLTSTVSRGNNTFHLEHASSHKWVVMFIKGSNLTSNITISSFRLHFDDNSSFTLLESINNGYIEPLVLATSMDNTNTYLWNNFYNIVNGGSTTGNFPKAYIFFKVKDKSPLVDIEFTANKAFDKTDGIRIDESNSFDLSIEPFE